MVILSKSHLVRNNLDNPGSLAGFIAKQKGPDQFIETIDSEQYSTVTGLA